MLNNSDFSGFDQKYFAELFEQKLHWGDFSSELKAEMLDEAHGIVLSHIDGTIRNYAVSMEELYKKWFFWDSLNFSFARKRALYYVERINVCRVTIDFLSFCRVCAVDRFLAYMKTSGVPVSNEVFDYEQSESVGE